MPTVDLPELAIIARTDIGSVKQVLQKAGSFDVVESSEVNLSPRVTETQHRLEDGSFVVLTGRRNFDLPDSVGVVRQLPSGRAVWVQHPLLVEAQAKAPEQRATEVQRSWEGALSFRAEQRDDVGELLSPGLRPPQIGALFSIGAHWSLDREPATIVMPTGTGKTEVMVSALVEFAKHRTLVLVPNRILRRQTVDKFATLGVLREVEVLRDTALYPLVGIIEHRPTSPESLLPYLPCHVVVATMQAVASSPSVVLEHLSSSFTHLFIDEAHHIPAATWSKVRDSLADARTLQFTATPYRRDRKLVGGRQVFSYPLARAQSDHYFKHIDFVAVSQPDIATADVGIANAAIERLRDDLTNGLDHMLLARTRTTDRADSLLPIYADKAAEFRPVVVHNKNSSEENRRAIAQLRARESRIVLCVDMFGEGFDLPNLKVAAAHDLHGSLPVLLQFVGRFTRSSPGLGDATLVANVANPDIPAALDDLYAENADWNTLLRERSSQTMAHRRRLLEFIEGTEPLPGLEAKRSSAQINAAMIRPALSATIFSATEFKPLGVHGALGDEHLYTGWMNPAEKTLILVRVLDHPARWTKTEGVFDREWDLTVAFFDEASGLLFIHSSHTKPTLAFANAITGDTATRFDGEDAFKSFGHVHRLILRMVGVKKPGKRALRYSSFMGTDVGSALTDVQKKIAQKALLTGNGYEEGERVDVGVSAKGKVWTPGKRGHTPEFIDWCRRLGAKLRDPAIDTASILEHVLVPRKVEEFPDKPVLALLWPDDVGNRLEKNVNIGSAGDLKSVGEWDLEFAGLTPAAVDWTMKSGDHAFGFRMSLGGNTHQVHQTSGRTLRVSVAGRGASLAEYCTENPPVLIYLDGSELEGSFYSEVKGWEPNPLPSSQMTARDWSGVDITSESIWKGSTRRTGTVQGAMVDSLLTDGTWDVVFDDDDTGEVADIVAIDHQDDQLIVRLYHCKFSGAATPGQRVSDLEQVCQQAIRSIHWAHPSRFRRLCRHLRGREARAQSSTRGTRFMNGTLGTIAALERASKVKPVTIEVFVVQPGARISGLSKGQRTVLAAANSFVLELTQQPLHLVASG